MVPKSINVQFAPVCPMDLESPPSRAEYFPPMGGKQDSLLRTFCRACGGRHHDFPGWEKPLPEAERRLVVQEDPEVAVPSAPKLPR